MERQLQHNWICVRSLLIQVKHGLSSCHEKFWTHIWVEFLSTCLLGHSSLHKIISEQPNEAITPLKDHLAPNSDFPSVITRLHLWSTSNQIKKQTNKKPNTSTPHNTRSLGKEPSYFHSLQFCQASIISCNAGWPNLQDNQLLPSGNLLQKALCWANVTPEIALQRCRQVGVPRA